MLTSRTQPDVRSAGPAHAGRCTQCPTHSLRFFLRTVPRFLIRERSVFYFLFLERAALALPTSLFAQLVKGGAKREESVESHLLASSPGGPRFKPLFVHYKWRLDHETLIFTLILNKLCKDQVSEVAPGHSLTSLC